LVKFRRLVEFVRLSTLLCRIQCLSLSERHTGWHRPIGCLKLQVIFAKETLIIGLFGGKQHVKIRHPMTQRQLVVPHTLAPEFNAGVCDTDELLES